MSAARQISTYGHPMLCVGIVHFLYCQVSEDIKMPKLQTRVRLHLQLSCNNTNVLLFPAFATKKVKSRANLLE